MYIIIKWRFAEKPEQSKQSTKNFIKMKNSKIQNIVYLFLTLFVFSISITSCEKDTLDNQNQDFSTAFIEDDLDGVKVETLDNQIELTKYPTPLQYKADEIPNDFSDYQTSFVLDETINNNVVSKKHHCPAFEQAVNQLQILSSCSSAYCLYLKLFWRIQRIIAHIDCNPEDCGYATGAIKNAYKDLRNLENTGIGSSYINDIKSRIGILEDIASDCNN